MERLKINKRKIPNDCSRGHFGIMVVVVDNMTWGNSNLDITSD